MKVLIAADSFKDALPALEVCQAIERGIAKVAEQIEVQLFPLGDGGEGTAEVLTWHAQGTWKSVEVLDPLFRPIESFYGLSKDGQTAYIEMAQASGLQLLKEEERNALKTSTFGTGQLIAEAIRQGAKRIVLGIGGSATNDVGIGMAGALGVKFLNQKLVMKAKHSVVLHDQNLGEIRLRREQLVGEQLGAIVGVDTAEMLDLSRVEVQVLCDVDNPLIGPSGATHTYARQKGANDAAIEKLEQGAIHFGKILESHFGKAITSVPGAGAAGGLGAGAMAFLDAALQSGINYVLDNTHFDAALQSADLIITGEGKIDAQTLHGKLIAGITKRAQQFHVPVIALCGTLSANPQQIKAIGLQAAFSILDRPMSLTEALSSTAQCLERTAFNVISTYLP